MRTFTLRAFRSASVCALGLAGLAGCSSPVREAPALHHHHEVALAWAADKSADGFHFPIACPGPGKLVLFRKARFQLTCNEAERVRAALVAAPEEPEGDAAATPAARPPALDCYLVVVPGFGAIAGVLTDMRKAIEAGRSGPLDCALIRYD